MGKQRNVMNKTCSPPSKGRGYVPEDSIIPHRPDIPTSKKDHFSKERLLKVPSCSISNGSHVITMRPAHLQISPYPAAEVTWEEEVISVLFSLSGAQHTMITIRDIPMPSLQHILGIKSIHDEHPSKEFDSHSTTARPDPWQQRIGVDMHMQEIVVFFSCIRLAIFSPCPNIRLTNVMREIRH